MKDDLDLNMSPVKMCIFMRYTCMRNIKSLSIVVKKLWPMLNLVTNKHIRHAGFGMPVSKTIT